jgi:hypothetical protein
MIKFISKNIKIILIILLGLLATNRLLKPGIHSMADEMHIFRLEQYHQCVKDGQIPCRYVPDAGFGYGYPLFNFYAPGFYAVTDIFHLIGFSLVNSIKIVIVLTAISGALGIFYLSNSLLASTLFLFAPYQAVNIFVRGAFPEFFALNLIPWVFYFFKEKKYFWATIFLSLILISHSLTSIALLVILIPYLFLFIKDHQKQFISLITAFGLSAFFLLPAFFEKKFTNVETMTQGYFYFVNHFATLHELFISRFWGYGASLWGPQDDMAISIGLWQWLIPLVALIYLFKKKKINLKIIFYLFFALFFIFLTHNKSTFIWKLFPIMEYFQFPWRFIGLALIPLSLLASKIKLNKIFLTILIFLIVSFNLSYFKEDIWYPKYDFDKTRLSGLAIKDYWPNYGKELPIKYIASTGIDRKSNRLQLQIEVPSDEMEVTLPLVYFPNWQVYVDNQPKEFEIDPQYGQIKIKLDKGNHDILLKLHNTPLRTAANIISLLSLIPLFFIIKYEKK